MHKSLFLYKINLRNLIKGLLFLLILCLFSCREEKQATSEKLSVDFEKYTLGNGLEVVLHVDKSDPIVSLAIVYHVGSSREVPGRTGFAHLFEHMMFQQSENVGLNQFSKKVQDAGGWAGGVTAKDQTIYAEYVPNNALELILWLESDRMGFLENTVTEAAFSNQQNVVMNEKRQVVDNRAYGHSSYIIDKNMFPEGHPYRWQVIGEMEDLCNATVNDVKEFHRKYYVPNNATLALAGDFDPSEARILIEKYFGEIPGGEKVVKQDPRAVTLHETKKLYHEDNFASVSRLEMVWPTVHYFHDDTYALNLLAEIISSGKKAPLYKVLIKEKELTTQATAANLPQELAGKFNITITANYSRSLAEIEKAVYESFERFEKDGITEMDLDRTKARLELDFYNSISNIYNKSGLLAWYNEFTGDPLFFAKEIQKIKDVTIDDIMRVYEKYIKNKHCVVSSFVPKGQTDMIAEGSIRAQVVEEKIEDAAEVAQAETEIEEIIKTPSNFDRSKEPVLGPLPEVTLPDIWQNKLKNGMQVYGIVHRELPVIQFNIVIKGGQLLDNIEKVGVASLLSELMMKGTAEKTPEELEEEIELLGADININAGRENISITVNTLTRNYDRALTLTEEILLEPRWDKEEFELAKKRILNSLSQNKSNPQYISTQVLSKHLFGADHVYSFNLNGTEESLNKITLDDLKDYYNNYFSPSNAVFHLVGNVESGKVMESLKTIEKRWRSKEVILPEHYFPPPGESKIYFVDVPGAKQSFIQIGSLGLERKDKDYFPATVMNYNLGGSGSGIVNFILRYEKGFTYAARTSFSGNLLLDIPGPFTAFSGVRSNATLESVKIFKSLMEEYREGISEEELESTKNALIKSNAMRFETIESLMNMLVTMSTYNLPEDYIKQEEEIIKQMTVEIHKNLARKYINPDKMIYCVVGDAATQMELLRNIGFGDPILDEF